MIVLCAKIDSTSTCCRIYYDQILYYANIVVEYRIGYSD